MSLLAGRAPRPGIEAVATLDGLVARIGARVDPGHVAARLTIGTGVVDPGGGALVRAGIGAPRDLQGIPAHRRGVEVPVPFVFEGLRPALGAGEDGPRLLLADGDSHRS